MELVSNTYLNSPIKNAKQYKAGGDRKIKLLSPPVV